MPSHSKFPLISLLAQAGLDAGFIPEAEFTNVKRAFLESLNIGSNIVDENHGTIGGAGLVPGGCLAKIPVY